MRRDNGLVFTTTIGTALDAQNVVNRHFKPQPKCAGLRDIRCHDLRHTSQVRPATSRSRLHIANPRPLLPLDAEHEQAHARAMDNALQESDEAPENEREAN
jgi:integrase